MKETADALDPIRAAEAVNSLKLNGKVNGVVFGDHLALTAGTERVRLIGAHLTSDPTLTNRTVSLT